MNKLKKKQNECSLVEREAKRFLETFSILEEYKNTIIDYQNKTIKTISNPCHSFDLFSNSNLYEINQDNFTFKLIDNSIIYYYITFDRTGNILKSSFSYVSGHYREENINNMSDSMNDEEIDEIIKNYGNDFINDEIEDYIIDTYYSRKKIQSEIIESIKKINRNSIVIRIDRDVENSNYNHPENHLTINNIENSRFKVCDIVSIYDFVVFIMDIMYGVKLENSSQYISLKTC